MSLSELTRNAFQSGILAPKWLALCQLFISKNLPHSAAHSIETEISNSVFILFRDYPGDPTLQAYLKQAIASGLLSPPTFLTAFLLASQSSEIHNASTLETLCRIALDHHYASQMPTAFGSLVPFGEPAPRLLATISDAMKLLKTACTLPIASFHPLLGAASELLGVLLTCMTDDTPSAVSAVQVTECYFEASELLSNARVGDAVRGMMDAFMLILNMYAGNDDTKLVASRDVGPMHRADTVIAPSSETDIVSCSLLLNHLIFSRAGDYGSGDTPRAVAMLVALLRTLACTPATFYAQIIISSLTCLVQSFGPNGPTRLSTLWRAFTVGRLPHLLAAFRKVGRPEGITEADWHSGLHTALTRVIHRSDLLDKVDNNGQNGVSDSASDRSMMPHSFMSEFLYQLLSVGAIEQAVVATINPNLSNDFHPRIATEAQEAGVDLIGFFEAKLPSDANTDDIEVLLSRAWKDPCCHAAFAQVVMKRFATSTKSLEVEPLGVLCKILCKDDMALNMLSLHTKITDLVARALAFVDDYECETVGDPQSAVSHLGSVVLFIQATVARFNLYTYTFTVGEKRYSPDYLFSGGPRARPEAFKNDEAPALTAWTKALFDPNTEGIEDAIIRATRPKTLLRIAPMLFSYAIYKANENKIEKSVFDNGVAYFLDPLLDWTLFGVIRSLLSETQRWTHVYAKGPSGKAEIYLELLKTLLTSAKCPPTVLALAAPFVLRVFPEPVPSQSKNGTENFDIKPIRDRALQAIGVSTAIDEQQHVNMTLQGQTSGLVARALTAARAGRAPALDVDRCLLLSPPTKFLMDLWQQCALAATMGDMEAPRRLVTFVLTAPRTPRAPPLLPVFLHLILPAVVAAADSGMRVGADQVPPAVTVEFAVAVASSALTGALHLEWAMTAGGEERNVLGQSVASMARRLSGDLRRRGNGTAARTVLERLAGMQPFVANFPTFAAEL